LPDVSGEQTVKALIRIYRSSLKIDLT
jgi:hypothetical protein